MSAELLDRIRKLINLAGSSERKEAEVAAYRACELIRKHGFDVVNPDDVDQLYEQLHGLTEELTETQRQIAVAAQSAFAPSTPPYSPGTPPYSPQAQQRWTVTSTSGGSGGAAAVGAATGGSVVPPPQYHAKPMTAPRVITSHFDTKCIHCGRRYAVGDAIQWMRLPNGRSGVWCVTTTCYDDWDRVQQAAATFVP